MSGIGWMLEDHLVEIVNLWRRHLARELPGLTDPALGYAVPVFLRELSRCLRDDASSSANPFRRCELLLKVAPGEGPAGVVHEFRMLRRAIWEVLRAHGRLVSPQDRSVADDKIDEAIAAAIGRLCDREAPARHAARAALAERPRPARLEAGASGRMSPVAMSSAAPGRMAPRPVSRMPAVPPRPTAPRSAAPPPLPLEAEPLPQG